MGVEGTLLNVVKATYHKLTQNIVFIGEKQKTFPLRSGSRQDGPLSHYCRIVLEVLAKSRCRVSWLFPPHMQTMKQMRDFKTKLIHREVKAYTKKTIKHYKEIRDLRKWKSIPSSRIGSIAIVKWQYCHSRVQI